MRLSARKSIAAEDSYCIDLQVMKCYPARQLSIGLSSEEERLMAGKPDTVPSSCRKEVDTESSCGRSARKSRSLVNHVSPWTLAQ